MIGSGTFIKVAPTVVATGTMGLMGVNDAAAMDWTMVIAVTAGIIFGMLWRAGDMIASDKLWKEIKKDLIVSLLISGANMIIALGVITIINIAPNPLYYMGIGTLTATMGTTLIRNSQEMFSSYMSNKFSNKKDD